MPLTSLFRPIQTENMILFIRNMNYHDDSFTTHQPCVICAKMIVNAGIERIVVKEGYPDELSVEILKEAGLEVEKIGE